MKYASYVLSVIGVMLLLNIFLSYSSSSYRTFLKDSKSKMMGVTNDEIIAKMNRDQLEVNTKILNSIDKLNENLDKLGKKEIVRDIPVPNQITSTGEASTGEESMTDIKKIESPEMPGTLVLKLMPDINAKKVDNNGIFGIKDEKILEGVNYVTYYDEKRRIRVYVFDKRYDEMLGLMKQINLFKINEADNFFGYTFYLNPLKKDIKNRFVTLFEGVAVGFEVEKNNYELLKKSLLN